MMEKLKQEHLHLQTDWRTTKNILVKEELYENKKNEKLIVFFVNRSIAFKQQFMCICRYQFKLADKTVNGYSYDYCSSVWERGFTSGHTLEAVAQVITTNRKNAPTGYMGAQARLYTSSGTLKYSSSMVYNDSPVINIYAYSSRTTSSGYFYAQSKVSFYNGNGYTSSYNQVFFIENSRFFNLSYLSE